MTTLYVAGPQSGCAIEAARKWDWDAKPLAVLVSYAYLRTYAPCAPYWSKAKRFMLDSGAYSAYTIGETVDLDALLAEACKPQWHEAVGLDVIGDWVGSKANAELTMLKAPTSYEKVMPVFHIGDPWDLLAWYCERWPKVGLSCRFGEAKKVSLKFYEQCFARAWPHKFHSFGWIDQDALVRYPFHSADAATAVLAPASFRNFPYKVRGRYVQKHLHVDHETAFEHGTTAYFDAYWRLEQQLVGRWSTTLMQAANAAD